MDVNNLEEMRRKLFEQLSALSDSDSDEGELSSEDDEPTAKRSRVSASDMESPSSPPVDSLLDDSVFGNSDSGDGIAHVVHESSTSTSRPMGPRTPPSSPPPAPPSLPPLPPSPVSSRSPNGICPMSINGGMASQTSVNSLDYEELPTDSARGDADDSLLDLDESSQTLDETSQTLNGDEAATAVEGPNMIKKTVLEAIENDHFDTLPENWFRITHQSGLHVYLHRPTRVITWGRPYMIGKTDSVRHHKLPLSAIPCLHQKRINEKKAALAESLAREEDKRKALEEQGGGSQIDSGVVSKPDPQMTVAAPEVTVERSEDNVLGAEELNEYARLRFPFKTIMVNKAASYRDKKRNRQEARILQENAVALEAAAVNGNAVPGTSKGIALITIPTPDGRFNRREFVLNPAGKTSLSIMHDYAQQVLKGRIVYDFDETRDPANPYNVTGVILIKKAIREKLAPSIREKLALFQEKMKLSRPLKEAPRPDEEAIVIGRGEAMSKKIGKMLASKAALKILIPNLTFNDEHFASLAGDSEGPSYEEKAVEIFDALLIEDPRITDLCVKTGHPKPFVLLTEACNRSMTLNGALPTMTTRALEGQQQHVEVTLRVGTFSATVSARGLKHAKQRAAQGLLKEMHPELNNFGSLLRLYSGERDDQKEARKHHDEVVRLQNRGSRLEPNMAVINKLKEEMARVGRQITADMPIRPPIPTSYPPVTN